ncbi:MAG: NAD(P)H-binding protein [Candidatus Velthaea sp.]
MKILITGASGEVGRRIALILSERGEALRLMYRDLARAQPPPGTETVAGDYGDPASLDRAFAGMDAAFIVSGNAEPGKRARLHANAIDAAARARTPHVVYLSFQNASPASKFPMGRDHFMTEQHLRASGLRYTALRDNLYLDILPEMFDAEGRLRGPAGNGAAAFVARDDVARCAAAVLTDARAEAAYDIAGPQALTLADVARRFSALTGRALEYVDESLDEARAWRRPLASAPWEVDVWTGSYEAIGAGELENTGDAVRRLTGRDPLSLEAYFTLHPRLLGHLAR